MKWIDWSPTARNLNSCSRSINAGTCKYYGFSVFTKEELRNGPLFCPSADMICFIENYKTSSSLISNTVTTISSPSHGSTLRLENSYKSHNARVKREHYGNERNKKCNFLGVHTGLYIHKHNTKSKHLDLNKISKFSFIHNKVIYGKGSYAAMPMLQKRSLTRTNPIYESRHVVWNPNSFMCHCTSTVICYCFE